MSCWKRNPSTKSFHKDVAEEDLSAGYREGEEMEPLRYRIEDEGANEMHMTKRDKGNNEGGGGGGGGGRAIWDTKCDYVFSLLGYAVGLGNIWRFPYLCYKNGGGAFLIPYFMMLIFVGIPLFLLEASMSQFCSKGGITIYSVCPALMGSGFVSLITNVVVHSYYSVIVSYPLIFLYHSFTHDVPWGSCNNSWNTPDCYLVASGNTSISSGNKQRVSSADEFFHRKVLQLSKGIGENGEMVWHILVTNIIVWVIVFLCIFKGIRITGKVVWFTATFPIVMLLILLAHGLTLPGAMDGIHYYLSPNFDKLDDGQVWAAAAIQIFFSLGPGWSTIIIMGSYNKFNNNCLKDSFYLPLLNCVASILAGFVVFSVLGFMAHEMNTSVKEVTAAGPALVFVTYPEALSMMPMAPVWSVLFFLMLFFVGIDSLFIAIESVVASVLDLFTILRQWRAVITVIVCLCMFSIAATCCTQGGMYVLQLMDWYSSSFSVLCVCLCEVFIFSYSYGVGRTVRDIQMMTRKRVNIIWYFSLALIAPSIMVIVLVNQVVSLPPISYLGKVFPPWAQAVGWLLALIPTLLIPIYFAIYICRSSGSFKQRVAKGMSPVATWGPAKVKDRLDWDDYCRRYPLRNRFIYPDFPSSSSDTSSVLEMEPLF